MAKILNKSLSNYAFRKPRLKDFKLVLGLLLPLFLIISLVSSLEYNKEIEIVTKGYPNITINKCEGFFESIFCSIGMTKGTKVAEYNLKDLKDSVLEVYSYGSVILYEEQQIFTGIEFKDVSGNIRELNDIKYYIYSNKSYETEIDDLKRVCENVLNKTTDKIDEICYDDKIGTKTITKYKMDWELYKFQSLPIGKYLWKIEGKKFLNSKIDFIPIVSNNIKLTEWAWWNNTWSKRLNVNVTGGVSTLSNFTVLISLPFNESYNIDFSDIRFVDGSCDGLQTDELKYEFDKVVNSTSALIWVKIPTLNTGINQICMYYNSSITESNQNPPQAWDSYYDLVYHFTEGTGTTVSDSKGLNNASFGGSPFWITNSSAKIGNAIDMNGGGSNILDINDVTKTINYTSQNFMIEQWTFEKTAGTWVGFDAGTGGAFQVPFYFSGFLRFGKSGGGGVNSVLREQVGSWAHQIFANNGENDVVFYQNKTYDGQGWAHSTFSGAGDFKYGINNINVRLDELRISSILRTHAWVNRSYDNIDTSFVTFGIEEILSGDNPPTITMVQPNNYANFSSDGRILWCVAYDDIGTHNLTRYIDGVFNKTVSNVTGNETLVLNDLIYSGEGLHNWTCMANDGTNIVNSTRYYTIDTTDPIITFNKPTGIYTTFSLPINITLNYTVQDLTLSKCYYNTSDNSTITMFTCNTTTNITFYSAGNKTVYYYANDTVGHETSGSSDFLINYITSSVNYSNTAVENEKTLITYFVNTTYLINNSATLVYNGTSYNMSYLLNGNNITFYYNLTAPNVNENTNYSFYINYSINGNNYDSSIYYQLVYNFTSMVISTSPCTPAGYKFSLYAETNQTKLEGATIDYNFKYGFGNNTQKEIFGTLTNVTDFYLCINDTINPYWNIGYGEIEYVVEGFVTRRYYIFSGTRLTNTTVNILLYDLATPLSTEFLITTQTTNLIPYVNHYVSLLRWYPENNSYAVVDMGKTDDKGQTILKVETVDVDYRIGIYETDGTLIQLINPLRMICQTDPCVYSLYVDAFDLDLTLINNIQQNLSYNSNTKVFTFIWNDPSQQSQTMNLTVYKMGALSSDIVCSTSSTSYTGVMLCDVSVYTGQLKAVVTRTSSPEINIASLIVNIRSTIVDAGGGVFGLFIGAILVIFFALIGAFNPIIAVIFGIMALIPLYLIGNITWEILMAIGVLGGVVIHFLRRTTL